jgi:hypothetical protein
MRLHPIAIAVSALLLARETPAQSASADSSFRTGPCPTRSDSTVDWNTVVTTPQTPARVLPASLPRFPVHLRRDGYSARIVVAMVIDTTGRVMPGTVSISQSTDPQLSAWGCTVALDFRFTPATVAGRPVNALSEQPLSYNAMVRRARPRN